MKYEDVEVEDLEQMPIQIGVLFSLFDKMDELEEDETPKSYMQKHKENVRALGRAFNWLHLVELAKCSPFGFCATTSLAQILMKGKGRVKKEVLWGGADDAFVFTSIYSAAATKGQMLS